MQEFDPHVLDEKGRPAARKNSARSPHVKSLRRIPPDARTRLEGSRGLLGRDCQPSSIRSSSPIASLAWNLPHAQWFVGGKLNVSYNCLDRHLEKNGNKPALLWEAERRFPASNSPTPNSISASASSPMPSSRSA